MALLPLFVNVTGRGVLLVGGGPVAASKLASLVDAGADVLVVAPEVSPAIAAAGVRIARRPFVASDLDGVCFVVSAAPPAVNAVVAAAAASRGLLVNAVDDPRHASAFFGGVLRRGGITIAISSDGAAPGLTALLRQALDVLLPQELDRWVETAARLRHGWRQRGVPFAERRPLLLAALNALYPDTSPTTGAPGAPANGAE